MEGSIYSKYTDIDAVMRAAKDRLSEIELAYRNSLNSQKIPDVLLVDIKAYLGDLKSALDYLNGRVANSDKYFPICKHLNDFTKRYGAVDSATKLVFDKFQPYNGNDTIKWFNVLNNKNKHVTLVPQTRRETVETCVAHPSGGGVSWTSGVVFGSGVSVMGVPIDPSTQLPVPNNIVKTERITWVDFVFDSKAAPTELPENLSALPFLKKAFKMVA
ncbi:MAG TPA: hypothetical protein VFV22_01200, partial [Candidatus Paceibacterota bacterium]|nr:hypothetical protein [Candidatus Paceibacterota bacterium]